MNSYSEKTQEWIKEINQLTSEFANEFGSLSENQLNWRVSPNEWSIGQNIDHIIVTNSSYFQIPEKISTGIYTIPLLGKFKFITSFFGNEILKSVKPVAARKIKTFPIWEPSKINIPSNINDTFKAHQNQLIDFIHSSQKLLVKETIISSPANKNIVYSLKQAIEIIISHEKRHFNQAKRILQLMAENP